RRGDQADGGDWRGDQADGGDWRGDQADGGDWRGDQADGGDWRKGDRADGPETRNGWRNADSRRRDAEQRPPADPWAHSAAETGVIPMPLQPREGNTGSWRRDSDESREQRGDGRRGRADRSDTGSWQRELESAPGSWQRDAETGDGGPRRRDADPGDDTGGWQRDPESTRGRRPGRQRGPEVQREPRRGLDAQRGAGAPRRDGAAAYARRREPDTSWQRELESGSWHRDPESDVWLRDSDTGQWHRAEADDDEDDEDDRDDDSGPRRRSRRGGVPGGPLAIESGEAARRGEGREGESAHRQSAADDEDGAPGRQAGGRRRAPEGPLQLGARAEAPVAPEVHRRDDEPAARPVSSRPAPFEPESRQRDAGTAARPVSAAPGRWDDRPASAPPARSDDRPTSAPPGRWNDDAPPSRRDDDAPPSRRDDDAPPSRWDDDRPMSAAPGGRRRGAEPSDDAPASAPPADWRQIGGAGAARPVSARPGGRRSPTRGGDRDPEPGGDRNLESGREPHRERNPGKRAPGLDTERLSGPRDDRDNRDNRDDGDSRDPGLGTERGAGPRSARGSGYSGGQRRDSPAAPVSAEPGAWRAGAQAAARADSWRSKLRAEQSGLGSSDEAATQIKPASGRQDQPGRGGATYRAGGSGDWRRELHAESDLADGESRRFGTSDFVRFRPPSKTGASASVKVPAANSASEGITQVIERTGANWQNPPDTEWPPRGAVMASSAGTYERRPVSTFSAASTRQSDLLEPEEEFEEESGGPLAAVGYTVVWYGVPVVLFVLYMLVLDGNQRVHALGTLADAAPQFGLSLVLSMLVAVGLRWASGSWKAASVGLASAVVGGGLATVLTSAITGQSLS
ncbi:hypothetical protein AB0M36_19305, partial [Actinoplanes sp. NPDC051346]|uniref:hypothetical protein n=1 Tax=Actinoplanes sp. NPDC051346 TaxID=3155048 RepID=UPI00344487A7